MIEHISELEALPDPKLGKRTRIERHGVLLENVTDEMGYVQLVWVAVIYGLDMAHSGSVIDYLKWKKDR